MWQIWLIISGTFFIGEIVTAGFLLFWFGIGALIAMISSFFTSNVIIQTVIFLITSTLLLLITKPFVKKFTNVKNTKTNAFSIIGKKAVVTNDIDPIQGKGQIKVGSETWSAESEDQSKITKDTEVEIVNITGVKAIVKISK